MKKMQFSRSQNLIFFLLVLAGTLPLEVLICKGGPEILYVFLMWTPAVAAGAAHLRGFYERKEAFKLKIWFKHSGIRHCPIVYIFLGCLFPLIYLGIPYVIFWCMNPESFYYAGAPLLQVLINISVTMVVGTFISMLTALGEEIGWRGFMVPSFYEHLGLNRMLLLSGSIWCLWHLPILIFGDYMAGTPLWYKVPAFILCILPVGILTGLLTLKSKSIWPAAFLHAAHNNYDQVVFGMITNADNKMYYVSETGLFTILCAWILAVFYYLRVRNTLREEADIFFA